MDGGEGWLSRTAEEDDGSNDTDAEADTTERRKQTSGTTECCDIECLRRTILLVNPPLMPHTRCKLDENV
jgi:hypothetical protein